MEIFTAVGVEFIPHYTPLHYLPFIARSRSLKSKPKLREAGFDQTHFRSKSHKHDVSRGFEEYAFLTLSRNPRIVIAKLKGGFPHISMRVPVHSFRDVDFDLCRYNVAMARRTPASPTGGFKESASNGRYYGKKALPIARNETDKRCMLTTHYADGIMIEVLVRDELPLPEDTEVVCYTEEDFALATDILEFLEVPWKILTEAPPGSYERKAEYVKAVEKFIEHALDNPDWMGDGLEFDRV